MVRSSTRYYPRFNLPMVSSLGFGFRDSNLIALFGLAFASTSGVSPLILLLPADSMAHYTKGTRSSRRSGTPTACKHLVSGTISSPFRGAFNLSLTVLVHYRSRCLFSLGGWSPQIQTGFHVSDPTQDTLPIIPPFTDATFTLCGVIFQTLWLGGVIRC